MSEIRFTSFPLTKPPPTFIPSLVDVFRKHESKIASSKKIKLESDQVLKILADDLIKAGWLVEKGKTKPGKIPRPVFYGENGIPTRTYNVDAYHPEFSCGMEIEAGRGFQGNAVYRDLIQSMLIVNVEHLVIGVKNEYWYQSGKSKGCSEDYKKALTLAQALYGHSRIVMPYGLTIVGY